MRGEKRKNAVYNTYTGYRNKSRLICRAYTLSTLISKEGSSLASRYVYVYVEKFYVYFLLYFTLFMDLLKKGRISFYLDV